MADMTKAWTGYVRGSEAVSQPRRRPMTASTETEAAQKGGGGRAAPPRGSSPFDAYAHPLPEWSDGDQIPYDPNPHGAAIITHASGDPVDVTAGGVIQIELPDDAVHVIPLASSGSADHVVTTRLLLVPTGRTGGHVRLVLPADAAVDADALAAVGGVAGWDGGGELIAELHSGRSIAVTWFHTSNFWVLHG
ncbi:hypothetical protein [Cereibacter azotoformans]|uniref:hypothetical protein n=1 Tax=Cereibacter azotoformans TaxID=43057 RepID=UPI0011B29AD6|nr:hypothetical protein [Cereibacter azotoformans]MBO4169559.1 hypothetical protein [Cereibacter azotoformans]